MISLDMFRVREDSSRARLLAFLIEHLRHKVQLTDALDAVFGRRKGSKAQLRRIIWSLEQTIIDRKLPFEFQELTTKKGMTIGLYPVENNECKVVTAGATLASINPKGRLAGDD